MTRHTIQHDGIEREYFVHLPASEGNEERPLVLALHGYRSSATGFEAVHGLNRHADLEGFIAVYPQGSHFSVESGDYSGSRITSWNDLAGNAPPSEEMPHCEVDHYEYPCPPECGSCDGCAWTSCYDDIGFLGRVIDEVLADYPVDADRVYLLGISNGAMMALQLACQSPQRFAAVAAIIGQLGAGQTCTPDVDVPLIHLGSKDDEYVPIDGRPGSDGYIYASVGETTLQWAQAMNCATEAKPWRTTFSDAAGLECRSRSSCTADGHEVVSCAAEDSGHWWPSQRIGGLTATCVMPEQADSMPDRPLCRRPTGENEEAGMALVWSFFERFSRPDTASSPSELEHVYQ